MQRLSTMLRLLALAAAIISVPTAMAQIVQPAQGDARQSGCQLRIEPSTSDWTVSGYNPFDAVPASGDFDVLLNNQGDGSCAFVLATDLLGIPFGLSRNEVGARVAYTLIEMQSGDNLTPETGHSRRVVVKRHFLISAHSQQLVKFRFQTNERLSDDGFYQQRVRMQAEDGADLLLADRIVTLGVHVQPQALIGLAGSFRRVNGAADIDLGTLTPGVAPVPLVLQVRSTRGYTISAESLNGGKLQLDGGRWSIPYMLVVGGRTIAADGGVYQGNSVGAAATDHVPLAFDIGDTSRHAAGQYSDTLTLTIAVR